MSYFIYARKSRKDAELEALGIDVLERHITTLLELQRLSLFRSVRFTGKLCPETVSMPAQS